MSFMYYLVPLYLMYYTFSILDFIFSCMFNWCGSTVPPIDSFKHCERSYQAVSTAGDVELILFSNQIDTWV